MIRGNESFVNRVNEGAEISFRKTIIYLWLFLTILFYTGCRLENEQLPNIVIISCK